ncbi:MAG: Intracellular exo-alpha-(1-_5)-L-arabinofuranosidase 1 [Opitutia bacterium UBA7350]|nr:MAG: Intracellular exo-alpha-(1->5)-L-arabinofuranosidase 1 [Opitutae bacterium UBA7350]
MPIQINRNIIVSITLIIASHVFSLAGNIDAILYIEADTLLQNTNHHRLIGTNLSLWSRSDTIEDARFQNYIRTWQPASIRIPGGSWSNEYYWNGNGVRIGDDHQPRNFDASKRTANGIWEIDYRAYKKGFRIHGEKRELADYHGELDVKTQHDWIQDVQSEAMVTVNVGSGTPNMAAEWVKWANHTHNYGVRYWEVGNELNGDWEIGHRLADGSTMTGEIYAQRFLQFAEAMRAEDPSIKLGGPACSDLALDFVEALIRDSGEALDFVSIHAYPVGVNTKDSGEKFAAIDEMRKAARTVHQWIETYQPQRKEQIEIGITEWNIKVNEDRDTAELINGIWSALWIGALFEEGIDFANQWDLSTSLKEGGHSAFYFNQYKDIITPKSQYWALWMWGNLMGDQLVKSNIKGHKQIKSFVTRSDEGLQIMLINTSEDEALNLRIPNSEASTSGKLHTFSNAQYFWDPHAHKPLWSLPPHTQAIALGKNNTITLPPFSLCVLELPWLLPDENPSPQISAKIQPKLEFLLPPRVAADQPIEAWLVAHDPKKQIPSLKNYGPIEISVQGPAKIKTKRLVLKNAAAPFLIQPTGPGKITLHAKSATLSTQNEIELVALQERAHIYWTFDNPVDEWNAKSTFNLMSKTSIRPNQHVAAASLFNALPARDADLLFHFEPLPREELPFENASGVLGKIRAAHNLKCADPKARINLVLQSDANHWIPIGSVPLNAIKGEWKTFAFTLKDPDLLNAMAKLYALRFQIQANAPVTGEIYLDDLGFIFRTGLE